MLLSLQVCFSSGQSHPSINQLCLDLSRRKSQLDLRIGPGYPHGLLCSSSRPSTFLSQEDPAQCHPFPPSATERRVFNELMKGDETQSVCVFLQNRASLAGESPWNWPVSYRSPLTQGLSACFSFLCESLFGFFLSSFFDSLSLPSS